MIRLRLISEPPVRLSLAGLLPERFLELSASEIERLPLDVGNRRHCVGDWFTVEARGEPPWLVIEGATARLDDIGAGMSTGEIRVLGNAGAYLGRGMRGGSLTLEGSAGWGAACDLQGGLLRITGDVGDGLGGALSGNRSGMSGGTVLVSGNAGERAGERLRRGLIVIGGAAGAACGAGMIAGTILAGGAIGRHSGTAMRRGSILALGGATGMVPSFGDCGSHDLLFPRMLGRHLAGLGWGALAGRLATAFHRFVGDRAVGGRGELLVPSGSA